MLFLRSYAPGGTARLAALGVAAAAERASGARLGAAPAHDAAPSLLAEVVSRPPSKPPRRDVIEELARVPSFELSTEALESGGASAYELLRGLTA
jgi:hypothetical protein